MKSVFAIFLSLFFLVSLSAQDFVGNWKGDIELPGAGKLGVIFYITQDAGKLSCKMDVPMQSAKDIPAANVKTNKKQINISFPALNGTYVGNMDADRLIKGTWSQNGANMVLNLESFKEGEEEALQRPQHPKAPFNYEIEEITVEVIGKDATHQLGGTLTYPKGDGPFPTAIMVTGSGPQDRDETLLGHKPFWVIADYFANNGIATFRYDDRGVGASTGNFEKATSMDFKVDAMAALTQIAKHEKVDEDKIGIVGHSEGALISALAAAESNDVKYVLMLAGPGVSGKSIAKRQMVDMARAEGESEEEIERSSHVNGDIIDLAASDLPREEAIEKVKVRMKKYYDYQATDEERKELGDFDSYFDMATNRLFNPWIQYFLKLEPGKYIQRIKCPTLALIGGKDMQVSPSMNIPALKVALEAAPTTNWDVREIPNLNHLFQKSRTGAMSEYGEKIETFNPQVLIMMRDWINAL